MHEPNLFLLGAQKAGTTTLSEILASHPDVFLPAAKETYFHCDDKVFVRGDAWYANQYWQKKASRIARWRLDATPFNLASRDAIDRIAERTSSEARFIVLLRDPATRAYSAWLHQRRLGNEDLPFADALQAEPVRIERARAAGGRWWQHGYSSVGAYGKQLTHAFAKLGRERVLVIGTHELSDPSTRGLIAGHLSLDPEDFNKDDIAKNRAAEPRSRCFQRLINAESAPKAQLRKMLPPEFATHLGRLARRLNLREIEPGRPDGAAVAHIRASLADDTKLLRDLDLGNAFSWGPS